MGRREAENWAPMVKWTQVRVYVGQRLNVLKARKEGK